MKLIDEGPIVSAEVSGLAPGVFSVALAMTRANTLRGVAALVLALPSFSLGAPAGGPGTYAGLIFHAPPKPLPAGAVTEDWPHFLGPHHNATTGETKLLGAWPKRGPNKVWEMAAGEGYACPVFAGGRLVYFHRVDGRETLDCLDPETGRRFWRFAYPVDYEDRYGFSPGPRSSAVIDQGRVYAAGVTAMLHCLELETGKVIWRRDLMAEFQIPQYFFGYGPTPLVWQDRVIVNVGGKARGGVNGTCVAAFDKLTGKTLWEVEDAWGAGYASPIVARLRGRDVALVIAAGESRPSVGGVLAIDPRDGRVFDRFPWRAKAYESVIAGTPLVLDGQRVFISECYEKGGTLLEFDGNLKSKQVWTERGFGLHWMMPLQIDGHLYGFAGRNPPDTEFKCLDAGTGRIVWSDDTRFEQDGRVNSFFRASLLRAGGRVFCLGEDGLLAEFELTPKGAVTRQRVRLFEAHSTWTLPALHRGLLYVTHNTRDLRDHQPPRILCYDFRGE
ncbi:MAG: PQQ-binding-like beta-propeller repeat protein [Verrucomicrobia bacterium]|nr:PQQ-binding-like beta-propeller repeat protein [Verrucomicrobiota bacterium]